MDPVRRLLAAGACLAVLGGLAGCGEDLEPQFEADPSESPSVAETPTASESAEPAPWEEKSPDGAVAFVEHWMSLFNTAETTGDVEPMLNASTATCETCNNFAAETRRVYDAGGRMSSDGWKILQTADPVKTRHGLSVAVQVKQTPQRVQEDADSEVRTNPGVEVSLAAYLVWRQGQWRMQKLDLVA